jgi:hypothetical protein
MTGNIKEIKDLTPQELITLYQLRLVCYLASDKDKEWPEARAVTIKQYEIVIGTLKQEFGDEG